jgi:hypothetical protein
LRSPHAIIEMSRMLASSLSILLACSITLSLSHGKAPATLSVSRSHTAEGAKYVPLDGDFLDPLVELPVGALVESPVGGDGGGGGRGRRFRGQEGLRGSYARATLDTAGGAETS